MVLEMTYPQLEKAVNPTHDIKLFAGRSNPKLAQEIADYLHINRTTYTYYERGKTQPSYDTLKAIIDFYNFEIEIEPKLSFDDLLARKINNKYLKLKEVKL